MLRTDEENVRGEERREREERREEKRRRGEEERAAGRLSSTHARASCCPPVSRTSRPSTAHPLLGARWVFGAVLLQRVAVSCDTKCVKT